MKLGPKAADRVRWFIAIVVGCLIYEVLEAVVRKAFA